MEHPKKKVSSLVWLDTAERFNSKLMRSRYHSETGKDRPMLHVFQVKCPACGFAIWLPRQSPIGIDEHLRYRPMGEWPLVLLCIVQGRVFPCPAEIHQESVLPPLQGTDTDALWAIACECDHEDCGERRTIHAHGSSLATASSVVDALLAASPEIACSNGHSFQISGERTEAKILEF
jgi:hypothetical protein